MSRSAFQRLNPVTQAGQFGNEGRNSVRGPGYAGPGCLGGPQHRARPATRLELRIESFNVTDNVNLGLPVADLNSANFGRILSAGPPRLMQFGVKFIF